MVPLGGGCWRPSSNSGGPPSLPKNYFETRTGPLFLMTLVIVSGPDQTLVKLLTETSCSSERNTSRKAFACGSPEKGMAKVFHP